MGAYNIFDLDPYRSFAFQVWENHKPNGPRVFHHVHMSMNGEVQFALPASEPEGWKWLLRMNDFVALDDEREPGWCAVRAELMAPDGAPYGMPRPQMVYLKPWVYPSHLIWLDGWRGPITVAMWTASNPSDLDWLRPAPTELSNDG